MFRSGPSLLAAGAIAALLAVAACSSEGEVHGGAWSDDEMKLISSLSLDQLPDLPPDPSNRVADDPAAAKFGEALFTDTRLSGNGEVSCATCHLSDRQFQDDLPLGKGVGTTSRRTMPLAGTAYSPWLFWDGRKDSQWSQALGPLENPVEHAADRTQIAHLVAAHYREAYETIFGPLLVLSGLPEHAAPEGTPEAVAAWEALDEAERDELNRVFANVGKAIAAFERTIQPQPTRFDHYAQALVTQGPAAADGILTEQEQLGLKLFIGQANCTNCHNGPLFTDNHFHNTGVPAVAGLPEDLGRIVAVVQVRSDPFNCLGAYSDADPADCAELRFMTTTGEDLVRAYKPPSLRGVANRPPYMHAGQIETLADVIAHYNRAPEAPAGHSELEQLNMNEEEIAALEAFLKTLSEDAAAAPLEEDPNA